MSEWQPIETAPKDGTEFLATDGTLFGVGYHYRRVEPETKLDISKWRAFYDEVRAPFRVPFTRHGTFEPGFDYLANCASERDAWEAAKDGAPAFEQVPNPEAGKVTEWFSATPCHAYDADAVIYDYDGPVSFTPTHWMPLPKPPVTADLPQTAAAASSERPAK